MFRVRQFASEPALLLAIICASAIIAGVIGTGCADSPPRPSEDRYRQPRLLANCRTMSANVICTALLVDVPKFGDTKDVTALAQWSVVQSSIAGFAVPGMLIPLSRWRSGHRSSVR